MRNFLILSLIIFLSFSPPDMLAQESVGKPLTISPTKPTGPVLYSVWFANSDFNDLNPDPENLKPLLKSLLDDTFRFTEKNKTIPFNIQGARLLGLMKEYFPERFEKLRKLAGQEKMFPAGATVTTFDTRLLSQESIIRQVLYGNGFFRKEFGKECRDIIFSGNTGLSSSIPSLLTHCGITSLETQLVIGKDEPAIPFNVGTWKGPDEKGVLALLNPGFDQNPGKDSLAYWFHRVQDNAKLYGVSADCRFLRVSGAKKLIPTLTPRQNSPEAEMNLLFSSSDQMSRDFPDSLTNRLPSYTGELGFSGAGALTSQAFMKRLNRKNELLAVAAEKVATIASWLGGAAYPHTTLNQAWWLLLANQQENLLDGSASAKSYRHAWNDEILVANLFSSVIENSVGVIAHAMDTRTLGRTVLVYNPLSFAREDLVEVTLHYPEGAPEYCSILGPDGKEVLSQVIGRTKSTLSVIFLARVPASGFVCFDLRPEKKPSEVRPVILAGSNFLENEFYKVTVDANGDIASIIDKKMNKELLSAPIRMEFLKAHPEQFPALSMDWNDVKATPVGFVTGPAKFTQTENGPVRVSLKVERSARNSGFTQTISLLAGEAGKQIQLRHAIEWQSTGVCLKEIFPLTASNRIATSNSALGTVDRNTDSEHAYEFPTREWIDLTDKSGSYGISLLEDCKYGADFLDTKTLRLSLLYTPGTNTHHDEATQDFGIHEFCTSIYSHKGDWKSGRSDLQGRILNQPLMAFQVPTHSGFLGTSVSMATISTPQVEITAMKNTETGDLILVRLQEMLGKETGNLTLTLPGKILSASEVDGQERKIGDAVVKEGKLLFTLKKSSARSFMLKMEAPAEKQSEPSGIPLVLTFDQDVSSNDKNRKNGKFDTESYSIPSEMLPEKVIAGGIEFRLGSTADGQNNVLSCRGQKIPLPKTGNYNRLYILAAATKDTNGVFRTGDFKRTFRIQDYSGYIGQFENRYWDKMGRIKSLEKGYIHRDEVAWFGTHLHNDTTDVPFRYFYLYKYGVDISSANGYLQLPENDAIKIFALTVADQPNDLAVPLQPLYDDFMGRKAMALSLEPRIVGEDFVPRAKITVAKSKSNGDLPVRVTMKDYADMHGPNGVTVRYFYSGMENTKGLPEQGQVIPSYNDGMFDLLPSDSVKDTWYDHGEGRVLMDLQNHLEIDSIHIFSLLDKHRGPQVFSLWITDKKELPSVTGDPKASGWSCIARTNPTEIEENGKIIYTIIPDKQTPLNSRFLLWISEASGHGPFYFREIDLFEKQK
jgi:alpha-mannosidase